MVKRKQPEPNSSDIELIERPAKQLRRQSTGSASSDTAERLWWPLPADYIILGSLPLVFEDPFVVEKDALTISLLSPAFAGVQISCDGALLALGDLAGTADGLADDLQALRSALALSRQGSVVMVLKNLAPPEIAVAVPAASLPLTGNPALHSLLCFLHPHAIEINNRALAHITTRPRPLAGDEATMLLYEAARRPTTEGTLYPAHTLAPLLPPSLSLRPYQLRALSWMVKREQAPDPLPSEALETACVLETTPRLVYDPISFQLGLEALHQPPPPMPSCAGGILADEMGLGKTVEVLALLAAHPAPLQRSRPVLLPPPATAEVRRNPGCIRCESTAETPIDVAALAPQALCVSCLRGGSAPVVRSAATLIVCPASIIHQWRSEIERHTRPGAVRVQIYSGVLGTSTTQWQQNMLFKLAQCDIVLTTYDTLRSDLNHVGVCGAARALRHTRKYEPSPTPLTSIFWWRVCMDEAQMIDTPTSKAAEMATLLPTLHRWVVSGTPLQRSLSDLYGLLLFLKVPMYSDAAWWKSVILQPYLSGSQSGRARTHAGIHTLMWRSLKRDVSQQLHIPPQYSAAVFLQFSGVEAYAYNRVHEQCVDTLRDILNRARARTDARIDTESLLASLDMTTIFDSLVRLRQCCCHPKIGAPKAQGLQKNKLSMHDLLQQLVVKARTENREALRLLALTINGRAGISLLENKKDEAMRHYMNVLSLTISHDLDFELDAVQRLHAAYNFCELLCEDPTPESQDKVNQLRKDIAEIYSKFLRESGARAVATLLALNEESEVTDGLRRKTKKKKQKAITAQKAAASAAGPAERERAHDTDTDTDGSDNGSDVEAPALSKDKGKQPARRVVEMNDDPPAAAAPTASELVELRQPEAASVILDKFQWWADVLARAQRSGAETSNGVVDRVKQLLQDRGASGSFARMVADVTQPAGLSALLLKALTDLEKARERAFHHIRTLPTTAEVRAAVIDGFSKCGRCQKTENSRLCDFCKVGDVVADYECLVFSQRFAQVQEAGEDGGADTIRQDAEVIVALRGIFAFLGMHPGLGGKTSEERNMTKENGKLHLSRCSAFRSEILSANAFLTASKRIVQDIDELESAKIKMCLRKPGEHVPQAQEIFKIFPEEVAVLRNKLAADHRIHEQQVKQTKAQLIYLLTLDPGPLNQEREQETENREGEKENREGEKEGEKDKDKEREKAKKKESVFGGECVICTETLTRDVVVLPCGHCFCCVCVMALLNERPHHTTLKCPTCRRTHYVAELSYVSKDGPARNPEEAQLEGAAPAVLGNYGTKIDSIVSRVLQLIRVNRQEKILIFSHWTDLLDILSHALSANHVRHLHHDGHGLAQTTAGSTFTQTLSQLMSTAKSAQTAMNELGQKKARSGVRTNFLTEAWKVDKSVNVLLLTFRNGSKGLNLTEAAHIILVEPSLHPADEKQAIGRVDRIGQTQTTHVHRFIMQSTVEAKIDELCQKKAATADAEREMVDDDVEVDESRKGRKTRPHQGEAICGRDVAHLFGDDLGLAAGAHIPSFWEQRVVYHGQPQARRVALQLLEIADAAIRRHGGPAVLLPPVTLHGRRVAHHLSEQLLALPPFLD